MVRSLFGNSYLAINLYSPIGHIGPIREGLWKKTLMLLQVVPPGCCLGRISDEGLSKRATGGDGARLNNTLGSIII